MSWHDNIDKPKGRVLIGDPGLRFEAGEEGVIVKHGLEEIDWNGYDVLIELKPHHLDAPQRSPFGIGTIDTIVGQFFFRPGEWEALDAGPSPASTQAAGGEEPSSSPPGAEAVS